MPSYLWFAAKHDINKSFSFIIQNNPFPSITGSVCDHLCKTKCTRINYDEPVKIREVKRYVSEKIETNQQDQPITQKNEKKICVIGGGISGLSCAWFLNQAGFAVDVFEADAYPGGNGGKFCSSISLRRQKYFKGYRTYKKKWSKHYHKNCKCNK